MSEASSGKTCVLCGTDCANQPRVKDPKGRYFCRPCYEKAAVEARRKREHQPDHDSSSASRTGAAKGASDINDSPGAGDAPLELAGDDADTARKSGGMLGDALLDAANDETAASAAGVCPNCGADFPLAAVICVNCGYNTTTGHTVEAAAGGTVIAVQEPPTNTIWPSVIGILAIVIGLGTAGLMIFGFISELIDGGQSIEINDEPAGGIALIIGAIIAVVYTLFMLWHGFAGLGMLQRREWATRHLRQWSRIAIAIVLTINALIALLMVIAIAPAAQDGATAAGFISGVILGTLLITAVQLAWPIFLLLWFGRESIEAEIAEWD